VSEPALFKSATARTVTTGPDDSATVKAGTGTIVTVEPGTVVEFGVGHDQRPIMVLNSGSVFAMVDRVDRAVFVGVQGGEMSLRPGSTAALSTSAGAGAVAARTQLTCNTGEVHIDWDQKQTRVLGPATCSVDPQTGPSMPFPASASKEACNSIDSVDHMLRTIPKNPKAAYVTVDDYLEAATRADATTLWNLLWRVPPELRQPVRDRLAGFINQPKVDAAMVLKLDPGAMDAWWSAAVEASGQK
jgi:hypothetical protein